MRPMFFFVSPKVKEYIITSLPLIFLMKKPSTPLLVMGQLSSLSYAAAIAATAGEKGRERIVRKKREGKK